MNKEDLVRELAERMEMTKVQANKVVDSFVRILVDGLVAGESIKIPGFASLTVVHKEAKEGRNPQNGEKIQIPATKKVSFKLSSTVKAELNGGK